MTIAEKNKDKIWEIACNGKSIAISKEGEIIECANGVCPNCIGYQQHCDTIISNYLKQEYCPFEKDELVEVSNDGMEWRLRYFSHMCYDGMFECYINQLTSTAESRTTHWRYCRKYGTLGGLVKE